MQILKVCNTMFHSTVKKSFVRNFSINYSVAAKTAKLAQNLKSWKEIPGPPSLPFIGPYQLLPGGKLSGYKGVHLWKRLNQLYGPIVRVAGSFGGYDQILLFDTEAIEHVFRSEETTPMRPDFPSLLYYRKGNSKTHDPKERTGLLTEHGETWRYTRSKINPILMKPNIIRLLYTDLLTEISSDLVARIRAVRDENNMIMNKFTFEINSWALESIGVVMLGIRLNCTNSTLPKDAPVRKLFQSIHGLLEIARVLDRPPFLWKYYSTPTLKRGIKLYQEFENLIIYFMNQAVKTLEESKTSFKGKSNSEKPVLEKLMDIDDRLARIVVSEMFLAGIDTVSNSVIFTLYFLATNPEKQNKLRDELLAKRTPRSYLRACIKESMRILPIPSGNARILTKEYSLLGYKIPKGVTIIVPHQVMSNMTEHYPKPDKYIPERWVTDKNDPLYHGNTNPFVMAPFGYGIRMCIARRIVELEMEALISTVIENFQIDWSSSEPLPVFPIPTNVPTEPFHFVFKDL